MSNGILILILLILILLVICVFNKEQFNADDRLQHAKDALAAKNEKVEAKLELYNMALKKSKKVMEKCYQKAKRGDFYDRDLYRECEKKNMNQYISRMWRTTPPGPCHQLNCGDHIAYLRHRSTYPLGKFMKFLTREDIKDISFATQSRDYYSLPPNIIVSDPKSMMYGRLGLR